MGNKNLYYIMITLALVIALIIVATQTLLILPKYKVMINNSLKMEQDLIGI